jgi:hypothetical protein
MYNTDTAITQPHAQMCEVLLSVYRAAHHPKPKGQVMEQLYINPLSAMGILFHPIIVIFKTLYTERVNLNF